MFSSDMMNDIEEIVVDDSRAHVLQKLIKSKAGVKKVESDHNPIISKLKF